MSGLERTPFTLIELALALMLLMLGVIGAVLAGTRGQRLIAPLLAALFCRALLAFFQRIYLFLPQGGMDARKMERLAVEWSAAGCLDTSHLNLSASYVHSWVISQFQACVGGDQGPLVFQMINVLLGVFTLFMAVLVIRRVWGREVAIRAAWIMAFFPTLVLYSVVELREVWMTSLLMVGVYFVVRWYQERRPLFFGLAVLAIMGSAVFHGGAIFAILGLGAMSVAVFIRDFFRAADTKRVRKRWATAGLMVIAGGGFMFLGVQELRFSSIGDVTQLGEKYEALETRDGTVRGGAQYPAFLRVEGASDARILLLTPVRMAYLLFAPFPWDIRAAQHVIGFFDGLLYLAMAYLLWRYRRHWWQKPELRILFIMFLSLTLVYAWGTGNFGTGMRHRAKFVGLLIVMAAGLLGNRKWRMRQLRSNGIAAPVPWFKRKVPRRPQPVPDCIPR